MRSYIRLLMLVGLILVASQMAVAQTNNTNTGGQTGDTSGGNVGSLDDTTGTISGDERFLRENRDVGTLVGGGTTGVGNLGDTTQGQDAGQTGRSAAGQSRRSNMMNQFNRMFQDSSRYSRDARSRLRFPISLGFVAPAPAVAPVVRDRVQARLDRNPRVAEMGSVQLEVQGRTAVLTGQVESEAAKNLIAKMMLLEPGIADVQNDLTVVVPQTTP